MRYISEYCLLLLNKKQCCIMGCRYHMQAIMKSCIFIILLNNGHLTVVYRLTVVLGARNILEMQL